jgi:hypothetical protein
VENHIPPYSGCTEVPQILSGVASYEVRLGFTSTLWGAVMAQPLRERINKWDYKKSKGFCITKEVVIKLKRLHREWKTVFTSYTSDKRLITRIFKELKKLNSKKNHRPNEKNRQMNSIELFQRKKSQLG